MRDHKAQLEEDARRKKEAESTAWMRRTRCDPDSIEQRKPKSTGSSSSDSPIRRVVTPPEFPPNWTAEEKANYERLAKEGVEVAVFEQHRLDQEKIVQHEDYMTVAWDGCKNIDIPWHRFKIRPSSVSLRPTVYNGSCNFADAFLFLGYRRRDSNSAPYWLQHFRQRDRGYDERVPNYFVPRQSCLSV
jgi:hypothetical protein